VHPSNTAITIHVPDWVTRAVEGWPTALPSDSERMNRALELSQLNVQSGGGPFAALVFAGETLIGVGVNRVVDTGLSIAHAEVVALSLAQQNGRERLGALGRPLTLVTTTEPCCQCFGALIWAGVEHLVCGSTTADAEEIGFDEGPKPANWVEVLRQRGVMVTLEVERQGARAILARYASQGGVIYGRDLRGRSSG
jgi:tRNA(Arg) A34 adenosine deaminase TadA